MALLINATASRYERTQTWTAHSRLYAVAFTNRKRAIKWALRQIEREFPDFPQYEATIIEEKKSW